MMGEQIVDGAEYHLRKAGQLCRAATAERDQLKAELAKLQAEREPRDNGDGTVTAWRPVTYPKGLDVVEVRPPKSGDTFVSDTGEKWTAQDDFGNRCRTRLILRHAPKPPEPVTWEAPLPDGEFLVDDDYDIHSSDAGRIMTSRSCEVFLRGYTKPPQLGTYQFRDGVGTLIQEAGNE